MPLPIFLMVIVALLALYFKSAKHEDKLIEFEDKLLKKIGLKK